MQTELAALRKGYARLYRELVGELCKKIDIPFPEHLCHDFLVDGLQLGYYACEVLGIDAPGKVIVDKMEQARANASAVYQKLGIE